MRSIHRLIPLLFLGVAANTLRAESVVKPSEGIPSVRLGAVYVPDYTADKSSTLGFELGYAAPVYPFENMVFSWGHFSESELEHNYFLLGFEDSYPLADSLALYGRSGIGITLLDRKPGTEKNSITGRIAIGLRFETTETLALFAEGNFLIAYDDIWFDGDELKNRTWQSVFGLQYKF